MNQREAVFTFVSEVTNVEQGVKIELSTEERKQVIAMLVAGFEAEEISLKSEQNDIEKYSKSLLANWLKKDKRLNGGVDHVIKNPGSRAGSGDEQVRTLRALKKETTDPTRITKIDEMIQARLAEIKPEKKVDTSCLSDEQLEALGLLV